MHPIIAKFGPITIYSYGMMIAIAFVFGIYLARIEAVRKNFKKDLIYDLSFYLIIGALIGARLYYLLFFSPRVFIEEPLSIFRIWQGGLAIHGGILGGIIACILFAKRRGISFWGLADLVAPSLLLGQAIGRIGCLLNGCCYGIPIDASRVHSTQAYEMVLNLIGFFGLWIARKKIIFSGGLFLLYLMIYNSIRIVVSSLRADSLYIWGTDIKIAQVISGVVFIIAVALYMRRKKNA
ncbi:MAG: prolipoprotein diacylglyceryl transferase [Candidatus Gorgyraea atricola]|nr:prolipoprotein diacylglyceryl transferase [Candidatus Gorgyraea atricola]